MIPKYLRDAIYNKSTSIGDNPALPPDEEHPFLLPLVEKEYNEVVGCIPEDLRDDQRALAAAIDDILTECRKLEEPIRDALQKLCCDCLALIFSIPDDTMDIDVRIVNACDMSKFRMHPEAVEGFQFEDMDDMELLTSQVYQRRFVDAIVSGAAHVLMDEVYNMYMEGVEKINPSLLTLYKHLMEYRRASLFINEDTLSGIRSDRNGSVDITIPADGNRIGMSIEATSFPFLMEYAIRGILEVATISGLPDDQKRAEYILAKADYRIAENWDSRIGSCLWKAISETFSDCGFPVRIVGENFIIMELANMKPDVFNSYVKNTLKHTKKGMAMTNKLADAIEYNKEVDKFNNFMKSSKGKHPINDDEYYTAQELLSEIDI